MLNRHTDVEIPKRAWSAWKEEGKPRTVTRALTVDERDALEKRRDELAPIVAGFEGKAESNQVALALADMLGSYRSMRQFEEGAVAQIDSIQRALRDFPAWAIEKACRSIQKHGVWREGAYDRQWPPNDSEIVAEVRDKLRMYGDQYNSAVALLAAKVDPDGQT